MPLPSPLANLDHDAALAEIASGTIARTIAQRYGVTAQAVRMALKRARPQEYQEAVQSQVEHWIDESVEEMDGLEADAVCIARARARADFRLKLAAALHPAYAAKREQLNINVNAEVDMGDLARRVAYLASLQQSVTVDNSHGAPRLLNNDTAPSSD